MRLTLDWLRDWVPLEGSADDVAADLTTAGLEVDSIEGVGASMDGIVVGRVLGVERHPNADRLSVCTVDDGVGEHQVVCGARNVAAGIKAPFARTGSRLPGGQVIAAAELRGVKSHGMLCSAKELGLADDSAGLLLLDADAPVGASITQHLRLEDTIFEVNVTPNRGDCFSVLGMARDLAAKRRLALKDAVAPRVPVTSTLVMPVVLGAGRACPRFVGRVVSGLRTDVATPLWMRERLRRAGIRPLHPVVDVTNYVMVELGQPLHAYDLTALKGPITARCARPGEPLTLLDGKTLTLDEDMLVIADAERAVGLAGIMGGQASAVSAITNSVFLEGAFFAPAAIAGRARRVGLHTDASLRFERGVDPAGQVRAVERATELILAICGGAAGPITHAERASDLPRRESVELRRDRLGAILGLTVPGERVVEIFERLAMRVTQSLDGWRVTPPSFRFDIGIEEDLIEEVGRMVGYDAIPPMAAPAVERLGASGETRIEADRFADLLVERGFTEVVTYSFVDPELDALVTPDAGAAELANPIASDLAVLRRSLWPGLMQVARHNVAHQRQRLKVFEIGPQFALLGDTVEQTAVVAGLALGGRLPEHWTGAEPALDFFDLKGDVEALVGLTGDGADFRFEAAAHPALMPGQTARILRAGRPVGWLGVLHPELQKRVDKKRNAIVFALELEPSAHAAVPIFHNFSKFPAIRRDLAVVVDVTTSAEALIAAVRGIAGALLQDIVVFDVYRGEGIDSRRKSIGLGLILQDASRTLTDEDADQKMRAIMLSLEREFAATIRT